LKAMEGDEGAARAAMSASPKSATVNANGGAAKGGNGHGGV
jgi:hypothetical protein